MQPAAFFWFFFCRILTVFILFRVTVARFIMASATPSNTLSVLPDEMIEKIIPYCDVESLVNLSLVNHHLHRITASEYLWELLGKAELMRTTVAGEDLVERSIPSKGWKNFAEA